MKFTLKLLSTLSFMFVLLQTGSAQLSFSHAGGGAYYYADGAQAPGFMYSPRLNFMEFGDMSLSIGTHAGIGFSLNASSRNGVENSSFALDLPVMLELNIGSGNGVGSNSAFGGYLGAGYGISRISFTESAQVGGYLWDAGDMNKAQGFVFNGGIRTEIKDYPIDFRVSYMMNSKKGFRDVISAGVSYTIGGY